MFEELDDPAPAGFEPGVRDRVLRRARAIRRRRRVAVGGSIVGALAVAGVSIVASGSLNTGASGVDRITIVTTPSPTPTTPAPAPVVRRSAKPKPAVQPSAGKRTSSPATPTPTATHQGPARSSTGVRADAAGVYYPPWRSVVVYGGTSPSGVLTDMWSWHGQRWSRVATGGPALNNAVLGVDPRSGALLLVGMTPQAVEGSTSAATGGRMWKWTSHGWSEIRPAHAIVAGYYTSVIPDPANHRMLVYVQTTTAAGSYNASAQLWAWSGADWSRVWVEPTSGTAPVPDYVAAGPGGQLIGVRPGTTARFTGGGWTALAVSGTPKYLTSFTTDPASGDIYVIGSSQARNPDGGVDDDGTYRFDGSRWTRLALPRQLRDRVGELSVWDASNGTLVVADGAQGLGFVPGPATWYHDTWTYRGSWTQVAN